MRHYNPRTIRLSPDFYLFGQEGAVYQFAIVPGDGIGSEIIREGMKTLQATSEIFGFRYAHSGNPYLRSTARATASGR